MKKKTIRLTWTHEEWAAVKRAKSAREAVRLCNEINRYRSPGAISTAYHGYHNEDYEPRRLISMDELRAERQDVFQEEDDNNDTLRSMWSELKGLRALIPEVAEQLRYMKARCAELEEQIDDILS